jgi:hypothetical protein
LSDIIGRFKYRERNRKTFKNTHGEELRRSVV